MTNVNKTTILDRMIRALCAWNFERLVVVVGHLDACVRDYLYSLASGLEIEFIQSEKYRTTNNIYSLWAARHAMPEPFLLLECDLVFHENLLSEMLQPDRIAVSKILPWMNGTTVALDHSRRVIRFHMGSADRQPGPPTHKTVNMYSFSRSSWQRVTQRLDQHILKGLVNGYYETVFAELVAEENLNFEAVFFDAESWYEIDTVADIQDAERLFPCILPPAADMTHP